MPFDGQPSRGCRECRVRRVKCDQTKPACQRCCRSNRSCSGYQPRADLIFRNMNRVAETKVLKRTQPAIGPGGSPSPERDSRVQAAEQQLLDDIQFVYRTGTYISPSMSPGWEEMAVTRFFADYTSFSEKFDDTLHFLPGLCRRMNEDLLLKEALHAVAFRSQGNQCGIEWMIIEAGLAYGRALLLLAEVSEDRAIEDSVLAAVYLLGFYEVVSGDNDPNEPFQFNHYYGRTLLLKLRGEKQFTTTIQRSLFRTSYALTCVVNHFDPPEDAERWVEQSGRDRITLGQAKCNIRLARICAEAARLFSCTTKDGLWLLKLMHIVKESIILDQDYDNWCESTYEVWPYHKVRTCLSTSDSAGPSAPQTSSPHIYHDIWVAFVWNMLRSCRIHLHEILLRCLDLIQSHPNAAEFSIDPQATRDQSQATISELISDICDSVPFCIGDIDASGKPRDDAHRIALAGYLLLWPLYMASVSAEYESPRNLWIRGKLRYISRVMGLRKAQILANRPKKEPWKLN